MSDALHVEEGMLAWMPAHDVEAGEVIDYYNVPRAGLLEQAGHVHYFECLVGDGDDTGVWAYSPVAEWEVSELLSANGPDEIDAVTSRLIQNRWLTVAIAVEDRIVESAVLDTSEKESAVGLARRMVQRWQDLQQAHERAGHLVDAIESV